METMEGRSCNGCVATVDVIYAYFEKNGCISLH